MKSRLKEKLWAYILENNPELMFRLQKDYSLSNYLEDKVNDIMPMAERLLSENKPVYIVEELCLQRMAQELRPSKFVYIREVIEEEFPEDFRRLSKDGILTFEVINLIDACKEIFESFGFTEENEDNRYLRYAIISQVHDYLL